MSKNGHLAQPSTTIVFGMFIPLSVVASEGFEPPLLAKYDPKSYVSARSTTRPRKLFTVIDMDWFEYHQDGPWVKIELT